MALRNVTSICIVAILFCEISVTDAGISHPRLINIFKETSRGFKKSTKMFYDEYCPNGDSDSNKTEFNCISYCWWNGFEGGRCTETNFCLCDWEGLLDEFHIPRKNFPEKPNIETVGSEHPHETDIRIKVECGMKSGASTSTKTQNRTKKEFEKSKNIPNKLSHNNTKMKNPDKSQLSESSTKHSKVLNSKENREHKNNRNGSQTNKKPRVKNDTITATNNSNNNQRYSRKKINNNQYNKIKTTNENHKISQSNHNRNFTETHNTEKSKDNISDSKNHAKSGFEENNSERDAVGSKTKNQNTRVHFINNHSPSKGNRNIENSNKIKKIYNENNTTNIKYNKTKEFVKDELSKIEEVLLSKNQQMEKPKKLKDLK
ncbi:hypothetical protein WA026_001250 [Henosepilachna vigintioctopunctata]|uniref:Uncharacterized protein n=1 Tax=Henosepilachna vigintioctopunctata TaxID=420089 RepID=A0AAW1URG3_9CUCU